MNADATWANRMEGSQCFKPTETYGHIVGHQIRVICVPCAYVAALGMSGMLRYPVWLDMMMEPSGNYTWIYDSVCCLFWKGVWETKKCPVAPVSMTMGGALAVVGDQMIAG